MSKKNKKKSVRRILIESVQELHMQYTGFDDLEDLMNLYGTHATDKDPDWRNTIKRKIRESNAVLFFFDNFDLVIKCFPKKAKVIDMPEVRVEFIKSNYEFLETLIDDFVPKNWYQIAKWPINLWAFDHYDIVSQNFSSVSGMKSGEYGNYINENYQLIAEVCKSVPENYKIQNREKPSILFQ